MSVFGRRWDTFDRKCDDDDDAPVIDVFIGLESIRTDPEARQILEDMLLQCLNGIKC